MLPQQTQPESTRPAAAAAISSAFPSGSQRRKIAIAVDLSDESAFAVRWAVQNYLRPGDAVILLHVKENPPTSVLYGADWGSVDLSIESETTDEEESQQKKLEDDFDVFTNTKANDLGQPLVEGS